VLDSETQCYAASAVENLEQVIAAAATKLAPGARLDATSIRAIASLAFGQLTSDILIAGSYPPDCTRLSDSSRFSLSGSRR
jgi:hypothetical protein